MSHKYFKDQFDDEEVMLVFRKHPVVMRRGLIYSMIPILLGAVPALIRPEYSYLIGGFSIGFLLAAFVLLPYWISWYFSVFIMTNQRFIQQSRSLFKVSVVDIGLEQIQMINYQVAGVEQTLLGYGTIIVQTYVGELVIHDVHHPSKIQKKMVGVLRDLGVNPAQRPMTDDQEITNGQDNEG